MGAEVLQSQHVPGSGTVVQQTHIADLEQTFFATGRTSEAVRAELGDEVRVLAVPGGVRWSNSGQSHFEPSYEHSWQLMLGGREELGRSNLLGSPCTVVRGRRPSLLALTSG